MTFFRILLVFLSSISFLSADWSWLVNGKLELGGAYVSSKNSESTNDEERITTINRSAETDNNGVPLIGYELRVTSPTKQTQFYLKDKTYTDIAIGGTYNSREKKDTFNIEFFRPLITPEAWKNPYDTTANREETDVDTFGYSVSYKRMIDDLKWLEAKYSLKNETVDEDDIAAINSSLARDLNLHTAKFQVGIASFFLGGKYAVGDAKGGAYAYKEYGGNVGFGRLIDKQLFLLANVEMSSREYDESHPLFGEKREEDIASIVITARYLQPFGWKDYYAFVNTFLQETDANIDFFDQSLTAVGVGMGMNF